MKISKEARRTSRQLFRACFAGGKLDEARARSVVSLVIEKKPRGYIGIGYNPLIIAGGIVLAGAILRWFSRLPHPLSYEEELQEAIRERSEPAPA